MVGGVVVSRAEAEAVLAGADLLCTAEQVADAVERMAAAITERLEGSYPLLLTVMNGGLIPTAWLATRLRFPLQMAYLHATRYRSGTRGGDLDWRALPSVPERDRIVLVVDDILDEGWTLAAIVDELKSGGAREVLTAVLVNKVHDRKVRGLNADFKGLDVADRYVFGCGMDYKEVLRNLPGIYAVGGDCAT